MTPAASGGVGKIPRKHSTNLQQNVFRKVLF
jgi:hypothetical protein